MASRILLVLLIATFFNGAFPEHTADDERRDARLFSLRGVGNQGNINCKSIKDKPALLKGFNIIAIKNAFKVVDTPLPNSEHGDGVLDKEEFNKFMTLLRVGFYCRKKFVAVAAAAAAALAEHQPRVPLNIIDV